MKERMISFLNSIGISDYDSFDMDFEIVKRNRFNKDEINMVILKERPWEVTDHGTKVPKTEDELNAYIARMERSIS